MKVQPPGTNTYALGCSGNPVDDAQAGSRGNGARPVTQDMSIEVENPSISKRGLEQLDQQFPIDLGRDAQDEAGALSSPDAASPLHEQRDLQQPLLFLADCARRGWDAGARGISVKGIPAALRDLPAEDAERLRQWTGEGVQGILQDQSRFFRHGLYGFKRDVSASLDVVQRGVSTEAEVGPLFARSVRGRTGSERHGS